jgi:hypothetical protein
MFQTALIRKHRDGTNVVDAGTIAETLLFYQRVHVVANRGLLAGLIREIGQESFIELVEDKHLTITFAREIIGVLTQTENYVPIHALITSKFLKNAQGRRISADDEIEEAVALAIDDKTVRKKFYKKIIPFIQIRSINSAANANICEMAIPHLADDKYVNEGVRIALSYLVPEHIIGPGDFFKIEKIENERFYVITNFDFQRLNKLYHQYVPAEHSSLSPEYLLSMLFDALSDTQLAAAQLAELIVSPRQSALIRLQYNMMMSRRRNSENAIANFQEMVLRDGRAVRNALESGERTFAEFLPVLRKAREFKKWLRGQNPDANLLTEYLDGVTRESWVSTLPVKIFRYIFTTGVGVVEPVSGAVASAIDGFLIDRLMKGWRPNQFIEGPLRNFLENR